ncbi:unnamed protein product, partial [Owenia fusiformis]
MEPLKSQIILVTLLLLCCGMVHNVLVEEVAQAHNQFSLDIYNKLLEEASTGGNDPGNLFFGPISITTAIVIAMLGTSGQPEQEMISAMRLTSFVDKEPGLLHATFKELAAQLYVSSVNCTLLSANGIFAEQTHPFVQKYLDDVMTYYDAEIDEVDFLNAYETVRLAINEWVENKTNDKIKDLIPKGAVDDTTAMVIVNAIYFKGLWKTPFLPQKTKHASFYGPGGSDICVNMMYNLSNTFGYTESKELDSKVLKLPYDCEENRKLSMYVILPNAMDGLPDLEEAIGDNYGKVAKLLSSTNEQEVKVWLPRFTFEYSFSVKNILKSLGMQAIFEPNGITEMSQYNLSVSDVIHKAFVEVNEEGTEASAATAITVGTTSINLDPPKKFRADHPFLFVIADENTKAILFMGRVVTPTECEKTTTTTMRTSPRTYPKCIYCKPCYKDGIKYRFGAYLPKRCFDRYCKCGPDGKL